MLRLPDLARAGEDPVGELTCLAQRPRKVRSAIEMMSNPTAPDRPIPVRILRKIGTYLLKRSSLCAESRCLRAEALKLADGPVAQRIIETAIAVQADAIVMGSRGLRLIDALGFGSASQEVFRSAPCTCIAVH